MFAALCSLAVAAAPLGFAEALALAERTPAVEAARRGERQRRDLAQAVPWLTTNPLVTVQPGFRKITNGPATPEVYVGLAQDFNLAGYGTKRRRAALSEAQADAVGLLLTVHEQRMQAAIAWLATWAAQGALDAATEELALASEWSARVGRAAERGALTKVDAAAAATYRAEAHLAVLALEGETFSRGVELNRLLAIDADEPARVESTLPEIAAPPANRVFAGPDARTPAELLADAEGEVDAARLLEVEAVHGFGLQVGALAWREGTGDIAAVGTLQLTLPIFERSQRERSVHAAALARTTGRRQHARIDANGARVSAEHELEHTAATLAAIRDELLPAAQQTVAGVEREFEVGETTVLQVIVARRALVAAKGRLIRAEADVVLARARARELISAQQQGSP